VSRTGSAVLFLALFALVPAPSFAQTAPPSSPDYVIGIEDVIQISVWMQPELDRAVTVNARGMVMFPPLGEIKAAGLTPRQIADDIGERLSTYTRRTTTVTITVTQYLSRSVFVTGAVAHPGRFGFERMPGILDLLSEAGGATPTADLNRVKLVRREGAGRRVIPLNVTGAMQGIGETLPPLEPGDIVIVPEVATGVGLGAEEGVAVIGAVVRPGIYPVGEGQDLWFVLAQAGGPNGAANLTNVRILARGDNAQAALMVDLRELLDTGNRTPRVLRPGDLVFIDSKGAGTWGLLSTVLSTTLDALNIVLVARVLQDQNK